MLVLQRGGRLGRVVFRKDEKRPVLDVMDLQNRTKLKFWNGSSTQYWLRNYLVRVGTPAYE